MAAFRVVCLIAVAAIMVESKGVKKQLKQQTKTTSEDYDYEDEYKELKKGMENVPVPESSYSHLLEIVKKELSTSPAEEAHKSLKPVFLLMASQIPIPTLPEEPPIKQSKGVKPKQRSAKPKPKEFKAVIVYFVDSKKDIYSAFLLLDPSDKAETLPENGKAATIVASLMPLKKLIEEKLKTAPTKDEKYFKAKDMIQSFRGLLKVLQLVKTGKNNEARKLLLDATQEPHVRYWFGVVVPQMYL